MTQSAELQYAQGVVELWLPILIPSEQEEKEDKQQTSQYLNLTLEKILLSMPYAQT